MEMYNCNNSQLLRVQAHYIYLYYRWLKIPKIKKDVCKFCLNTSSILSLHHAHGTTYTTKARSLSNIRPWFQYKCLNNTVITTVDFILKDFAKYSSKYSQMR